MFILRQQYSELWESHLFEIFYCKKIDYLLSEDIGLDKDSRIKIR